MGRYQMSDGGIHRIWEDMKYLGGGRNSVWTNGLMDYGLRYERQW